MRRILVGAMVAAVMGGGPAFGGMDGAPCDRHVARSVRYDDVIVERHHNAGAEFGLAVAASTISVLYTPVRFVYGVVGAALGGFAGGTTGGDMRTAKGIWRPTTEGHYFVRPDYLDGTERFRFCGAVPPRRASDYEVVAHESVAVRDAAPRPLDAPPYDDAEIDDAL